MPSLPPGKKTSFSRKGFLSKLKKLKKLKKGYIDNWEPEFRARYLNPKPEDPLPQAQMETMVHLGCINGTYINDIVTTSLSEPIDFTSFALQLQTLRDIAKNGYGIMSQTTELTTGQYNSIVRDLIARQIYIPGIIHPGIASINNNAGPDNPVSASGLTCREDGNCGSASDLQGSRWLSTRSWPVFTSQMRPPPTQGWDNINGRINYRLTSGNDCGDPSENPELTPCSEAVRNVRLEDADASSQFSDLQGLFGFQSNTIVSSNLGNINSSTQPPSSSPSGVTLADIENLVQPGWQTPFQNNVYLSSNLEIFTTIYNEGYGSVQLSKEGLLWTLWPLTRQNKTHKTLRTSDTTYFDGFVFGTAMQSQYAIGQQAYFSNNRLIGCTPMGSIYPTAGRGTANNSLNVNISQLDLSSSGIDSFTRQLFPIERLPHSSKNRVCSYNDTDCDIGITPGIQNFNNTLITTTQTVSSLVSNQSN